jgi:hypothetical protein
MVIVAVNCSYERVSNFDRSSHQQISASDIEDEAFGAGKASGGHYASGWTSAETNSRPMIVRGGKRRDVRFSLIVP